MLILCCAVIFRRQLWSSYFLIWQIQIFSCDRTINWNSFGAICCWPFLLNWSFDIILRFGKELCFLLILRLFLRTGCRHLKFNNWIISFQSVLWCLMHSCSPEDVRTFADPSGHDGNRQRVFRKFIRWRWFLLFYLLRTFFFFVLLPTATQHKWPFRFNTPLHIAVLSSIWSIIICNKKVIIRWNCQIWLLGFMAFSRFAYFWL